MIKDIIQIDSSQEQNYSNELLLDKRRHINLKKRPKRHKFIKEFAYPDGQFQNIIFSKIRSIKCYLYKERSDSYNDLSFTKLANHLKIACRHCEMKIILMKRGGRYLILRFQNKHFHKVHKYFLSQQNSILEFIKSTNLDMDSEGAKKVVTTKFSISQRRFYYLKQKFIWNIKTFQQLQQFLASKKLIYNFKKLDIQEFPSYLVIVSQQMYQHYQRYGDCLRFDVTFNIIRHKTVNNKNWNVGIFSGFLANLSPIIFGFVFLSDSDSNTYQDIFKMFFKIVKRIPQSIITDQEIALGIGIMNLKKTQKLSFGHFLDRFHILNNIGKRLQNTEDLIKFADILTAKNEEEVIEGIAKIAKVQFRGSSVKGIYRFIKKIYSSSHLFCQNKFYGLSITTSPAQKINDMIKSKIRYESSFSKVIDRIEQLSVMMFAKDQCGDSQKNTVDQNLLQTFKDESLINLKNKIGPKVFNYFFKNYLLSLKCKIKQLQNNLYQIYLGEIKQFVDSILKKCTCSQQIKTGILCPHLIVFCQLKNINYLYLINQRWLI